MDESEKVIHLVSKRDVLWNLNNSNYKNVKYKAKEWQAIAEELRLPINSVKKKWRGLRDNYARNLAKKKVSGQGTDDDTEMGGKYSTQLEFLRGHLKRKLKTESYVEEESQEVLLSTKSEITNVNKGSGVFFCNPTLYEYVEDPSFCPAASSTIGQPSTPQQPPAFQIPRTSSTTKRKEVDMEKTFINTMASFQEFLSKSHPPPSLPQPSNSEDELFCRSLVEKLSTFPVQLRNDTKLEMLRYLNAVEADWLKKSFAVPRFDLYDNSKPV